MQARRLAILNIGFYMDLKNNFSRYLEALEAEVFMKDGEGRYIFTNRPNPEWAKPGVSIIGKFDSEVQLDENMARQCRSEDLEVLTTGKKIKTQCSSVIDGRKVYYEIVKTPVYDDNGNIAGITCIASDVTEKVNLEQKLLHYYRRDALTGLYNRNYLNKWQDSKTIEYPLAVLVLDCNHLKHINDTYGHKAGDEMLGMVAAAIEANIGKGDFAFRVGGDEFAIICNKTDEARAKQLVQKLHFELSGLYLHGVMLSASIGYACVKDNSKEIPQMYKEADHMMYENKRKYHEFCAKQKAVEAELREASS